MTVSVPSSAAEPDPLPYLNHDIMKPQASSKPPPVFIQAHLAQLIPPLKDIRDRTEPNYRVHFDNMVADAKSRGIQVPIITFREGDRCRIIDGLTRYLAALMAQLDTVPVLVYPEKPSEAEIKLGTLLANSMRRDMKVLELAAKSVAAVINKSNFSANVLLKPGTTIYFILPVEQLTAQRGFLRLIVSTFMRHIMRHKVKNGGETLFLLDECAALSGLDALEQSFVLGRGNGIRLYTFWQSVDQARAAFVKTPNLVSDNSDTQVYFSVNSYATAELVSKTLGTWTMVIEKANEGESGGRSSSSVSTQGDSRQTGWSRSIDYSEHARPLLNPAEVIQLSGEYFIGLVKGCPPIFARRLKFYSGPTVSTIFEGIVHSVVVVLYRSDKPLDLGVELMVASHLK